MEQRHRDPDRSAVPPDQRQDAVQLERLVNAVPGLVWATDADGEMTFLSQPYLDYLDKASRRPWRAVGGCGSFRRCRRPLSTRAAALAKGKAVEHEVRLRRADGAYRWMLFHANPSFDEAGKLSGWVGVNIDIENRKGGRDALRDSEAALRESERQLQQIIASIPGLTWRADAQGNITYWSQTFFECTPAPTPRSTRSSATGS
ncbi:PAS domain-containing protein [Caulobacter segnis]